MSFKQYLQESLNKLISNEMVYNLVQKIHRNYDDFIEGDLGKRLDEYDYYELKDIDIIDIDLDEWEVMEYLVDKYMKQIEENKNYPPIVLSHDMSIIDGIHRANALKRLGFKKIKSYVGVYND
jgi:hypothetical protein